MKLYCKDEYHNSSYGLHFTAGVIEVDEARALFMLRDAPDNFTTELPVAKTLDAPPHDKALKTPTRKK